VRPLGPIHLRVSFQAVHTARDDNWLTARAPVMLRWLVPMMGSQMRSYDMSRTVPAFGEQTAGIQSPVVVPPLAFLCRAFVRAASDGTRVLQAVALLRQRACVEYRREKSRS
jgi:hypothetical protein